MFSGSLASSVASGPSREAGRFAIAGSIRPGPVLRSLRVQLGSPCFVSPIMSPIVAAVDALQKTWGPIVLDQIADSLSMLREVIAANDFDRLALQLDDLRVRLVSPYSIPIVAELNVLSSRPAALTGPQ